MKIDIIKYCLIYILNNKNWPDNTEYSNRDYRKKCLKITFPICYLKEA